MLPVDTYQAEYETKFKKELSYFPECSLFLPPCFYSLSNVYGAPTTGPWLSFRDLKVEKTHLLSQRTCIVKSHLWGLVLRSF